MEPASRCFKIFNCTVRVARCDSVATAQQDAFDPLSVMSSASFSGAAAPTAHTDWQGEVVFNVGLLAVSQASQAWGPRYGRAHILGLTPIGTDIRGNVTVLVSGAAFHNFGARSPPTGRIQA